MIDTIINFTWWDWYKIGFIAFFAHNLYSLMTDGKMKSNIQDAITVGLPKLLLAIIIMLIVFFITIVWPLNVIALIRNIVKKIRSKKDIS